jgi:glycosyltransferase involved in cell wall biosynthesis
LLGWKTSAEISDLLDQSTALVLPSFAEGLPVVIMESFCRARPVLTTRIAGIPELVDSSCGLLCSAGDVEGLVEEIKKLIGLELPAIDALGAEGRRRVVLEHNPITEAEKLASYINA